MLSVAWSLLGHFNDLLFQEEVEISESALVELVDLAALLVRNSAKEVRRLERRHGAHAAMAIQAGLTQLRGRQKALQTRQALVSYGRWHFAVDIKLSARFPLLRSLSRAKRTSQIQVAMSAFDPKRTSAVHCGNDFSAGFSLYRSTRLSR